MHSFLGASKFLYDLQEITFIKYRDSAGSLRSLIHPHRLCMQSVNPD
jgi:hypothetical protein